MAEEEAPFQPRAVKDVPAEQFIEAYAAHLKTNDKVSWRPAGSAEAQQPGLEGVQRPARDTRRAGEAACGAGSES